MDKHRKLFLFWNALSKSSKHSPKTIGIGLGLCGCLFTRTSKMASMRKGECCSHGLYKSSETAFHLSPHSDWNERTNRVSIFRLTSLEMADQLGIEGMHSQEAVDLRWLVFELSYRAWLSDRLKATLHNKEGLWLIILLCKLQFELGDQCINHEQGSRSYDGWKLRLLRLFNIDKAACVIDTSSSFIPRTYSYEGICK